MSASATGQTLRSYPAPPSSCYVQLRPIDTARSAYADGEDQPLCRAVLRNLNQFCDSPPQYSKRRLAPSVKDLSEPKWEILDARTNIPIVKEAFTATATTQEFKDSHWAAYGKRQIELANQGMLGLKTATLDIDSDGIDEQVFILENSYPEVTDPGINSPIFYIAEKGEKNQSLVGATIGTAAIGDLWAFEKNWYSIRFDFFSLTPRLLVGQIIRSDPTRISAITQCTIQYKNETRGLRK